MVSLFQVGEPDLDLNDNPEKNNISIDCLTEGKIFISISPFLLLYFLSFHLAVTTSNNDSYQVPDSFLDEIITTVNTFDVKIAIKGKMFSCLREIIVQANRLYISSIKGSKIEDCEEVIDACSSIICNKLEQQSTKYKRDKELSKMSHYVKPETYHVSTYWDFVIRNSSLELKSSTFEYVSIIKTLESLFWFEEYYDAYLKYNHSHEHV